MLSYFVNFGIVKTVSGTSPSQWRVPFGMQLIPGIFLLVGMIFQPESPRWLVEKNRVNDARLALARVRRLPIDDQAVTHELEEIVLDFHGKEDLSWIKQLKMSVADKPTFYRCFLGIVIQIWQQWTGKSALERNFRTATDMYKELMQSTTTHVCTNLLPSNSESGLQS